MKAVNTLRIAGGRVFFGPGPRMLLEAVEAHSSLRQATISLRLSYTKALRMLRLMERELGFAVVETHKGGSGRGGTSLTEGGRRLLQAYREAQQEVDACAARVVAEKFAYLESKK